MSLTAKVEAIIYAAEEPVTFEQIFALVKEDVREQLRQRRETASNDAQASTPEVQPEFPAGADSEHGGVEVSAAPAEDGREALAAQSAETAPPQEPAAMMALVPADVVPPNAAPTQPVENAEPAIEPAPVPESAITDAEVKSAVRAMLQELIARYNSPEHGIEVRQIAGGFRMATKPEQHDVVRAFSKSLKPPIRLSLQALETLAVIAYKQPITAPEISEVRGVDCSGVLGTLLDRKLITTAGRKQVVGRPILYKTTKDFLLQFGLKDVGELPSMEEFEKLAAESLSGELFTPAGPTPEQAASQTAATEAPMPAAPPETVEGVIENAVEAPPPGDSSPEHVAEQTAATEAPLPPPPATAAPQPQTEPQPEGEQAEPPLTADS